MQCKAITSAPNYFWCCNYTLFANLFYTRGARGSSGLMRTLGFRAPRPLPAVAGKPKNFPSLFLIFGGGCGGSRQKMERKFLVLLRRFRLLKEHYHFITFGCSFLRPCGEMRHFLSVLYLPTFSETITDYLLVLIFFLVIFFIFAQKCRFSKTSP